MRSYLNIVVINFLIFIFIPLCLYAIDDTKIRPDIQSLTMKRLIDNASKFDIKLVDWRDIEKTQEYKVDNKKLNTQEAWLDFLKKQFEGSYALESDGTISRMYLLPVGVTATFIQEAQKYSKEITLQQGHTQIQNAQKLKEMDIMLLPEVQTLKELASMENNRTIAYERMVNPQDNPYVYGFKVKYIDAIKMVAPFEKNGLPVKNEMEGFSSFNTFYDYLKNNAEKCQVSRYKNVVFFQTNNGTQNIIALSGASDDFHISSIVRRDEMPVMETYLSGNKNKFKSLAKIYSTKGTIIMVDNAKIY